MSDKFLDKVLENAFSGKGDYQPEILKSYTALAIFTLVLIAIMREKHG